MLGAAWLVYEVLRYLVVRTAKARYEAQVDRFLRENEIPTDNYRHTHRVVVKETVLAEPGLVEAMAARARADGTSVAQVRERVRHWLDEIVPQFNLFAYYKVGYALGRTFAYALYNVRLDQASLRRAQAAIPEGASVVYVSNHRSNADFVVTGFMLSRSVQVSYAVGEWARVWPLEGIFKSFGSYFVRRGERDPLYHRTLETYLQLITKQKVTQAMFPEGGLSRDGALRPVKLGLLDYMAKAKLDPTFTAPLVFVPVGINFDRVLEDNVLTGEARAEADATAPRRSTGQKVARIGSLLGRTFVGVPLNVARFATKRLKKHGVCAIHFGEPVSFDDWLAANGGQSLLEEPDRKARQERLRPFAEDLLDRIGANVPVTPATVVCLALVELGEARATDPDAAPDRGDLILALRTVTDRLKARGAPFFTGNPYEAHDEDQRELRREMKGHKELVDVSLHLGEADDLDEILDLGLDVLEPRGILASSRGPDGVLRFRADGAQWHLVTYYANSLAPAGLQEK